MTTAEAEPRQQLASTSINHKIVTWIDTLLLPLPLLLHGYINIQYNLRIFRHLPNLLTTSHHARAVNFRRLLQKRPEMILFKTTVIGALSFISARRRTIHVLPHSPEGILNRRLGW